MLKPYILGGRPKREKKLGIRPVFEESSSRSFFELATEYIKDQAIQHPRSLKSFKWFTKILKEEFRDLPLQNFTAQRVKQFHNKNIQRGWSPSICNRLVVILRHMMRNVVDWGWIGEEVLLRVKKDQLLNENERKECLQPKECKQLINACDDAIRPIVILALGTGMRKGEILDLTWDQVDMENGFITLAETKNKEPRKVPINGLLRSVL